LEEGARCETCNADFKSDKNGGCVECGEHECCGATDNKDVVGENCSSCVSDKSECSACLSGHKLVSGTCVKGKDGSKVDVLLVVFICVDVVLLIGIIVLVIVFFVVLPRKKKNTKDVQMSILDKDDEAGDHDDDHKDHSNEDEEEEEEEETEKDDDDKSEEEYTIFDVKTGTDNYDQYLVRNNGEVTINTEENFLKYSSLFQLFLNYI